jgi:plastocyanin
LSDFTSNCEIMLTISKFGTLLVAVLAILILGELATLTMMTPMKTPAAFAQPTQQQQRQSNTNNGISVVSSSVLETDFGFTFIIGEIRNDSPEVVGTVTIVGSFHDANGNLIDTTSTFAELSQLRPGEKSPFRMGISDESILERMDNYTLSVEANPVFGDPKPAALRIEVSEQRLNEFDQYEIVGQVTNTGSDDTSLVQVIASFYDEAGELIATEFTFLASDLPAGQSGPFKITVPDGEEVNEATVELATESTDYVTIDPELEQQQQQSQQGASQQQNDAATTAPSPSQATTESLFTDAVTSGNNISASAGGGGIGAEVINQLTARAISYAEQANTALQSNDTEDASRNLNFALNELENIQGNLTSSMSGSNSMGGTNGDSNTTSAQATTSSSTPSSQPQQQEQPPSSSSPFSQQLQSQQEQEEGPPQQQSLQQEQNVGGTSVSIVEDSSTKTTDAFSPNPIQVSVGSTVTWTNDDSVIHTVNSGTSPTESGLFSSPIMNPGDTFEYTFTEAGEVPYFCLLHPNMVGTANVS